jgi:hypothetical protein
MEQNISYEEVVKTAVKICKHTQSYTLDKNHLQCAIDIMYSNDYEQLSGVNYYEQDKYTPYLKMAESTLRIGIRNGIHHRYPSKLAKDAIKYMACIYHYNINGVTNEI